MTAVFALSQRADCAVPLIGFVTVEWFVEGFVEGWTWTLGRRNLELTMSVSNSIYSTLDVQWEDYNPLTQWQNLDNTTMWLDVI